MTKNKPYFASNSLTTGGLERSTPHVSTVSEIIIQSNTVIYFTSVYVKITFFVNRYIEIYNYSVIKLLGLCILLFIYICIFNLLFFFDFYFNMYLFWNIKTIFLSQIKGIYIMILRKIQTRLLFQFNWITAWTWLSSLFSLINSNFFINNNTKKTGFGKVVNQ